MTLSILLGYLFPIAILLVTALVLSAHSARANAPALFLIMLWIVMFFLHAIFASNQFFPLYSSSLIANTYVMIGIVTFSFSFALSRTLIGPFLRNSQYTWDRVPSSADNSRHRNWLDWLCVLYAFLVLVWMRKTATDIIGSNSLIESMQFLRYQLNYQGMHWGLVKYAGFSVYVLSVFLVTANKNKSLMKRLPSYAIVALAILIAVISTQRTSLFMLLIALAFATSHSGIPSWRTGLILFATMMIAFLGVGLLVGKAGGLDLPFAESIALGFRSILLYLLSPLSALDQSSIWENPRLDGGYSLRFFLAMSIKLGFTRGELPSLILEFIRVPLPTNVYTFLYAPISDFGRLFFVYFLFVGALMGAIFSFPRQSVTSRTLQGFCYYPIATSFFQDQFLTITSQWFQIIIYVGVINLLYARLQPQGRR